MHLQNDYKLTTEMVNRILRDWSKQKNTVLSIADLHAGFLFMDLIHMTDWNKQLFQYLKTLTAKHSLTLCSLDT